MEKQGSSIFNFNIFLLKTFTIIIIVGFIFSYAFEKLIINENQSTGASKLDRILTVHKKEEIPIFGSSRAEGNFVPSVFGKKFYNYGIAGTQANIWLYFLEEELKKDKKTPIIINFDLQGLIYANGAIFNYIPNWQKTKNIIKGKGKFYYNIPFFKYFGLYEQYFASFIQNKMNVSTIADNGAVLQKNAPTKTKFKETVIKRTKKREKTVIEDKLAVKFEYLINLTKRDIILVISPYHESCFNKNINYNKADEYLNQLEKNKNIRIIDLRKFIKDDDLFLNTTHLNSKGAYVFSKKLKEIL